ncbi:MAG: DUF4102 domain-containing protein, partial [Acidisphaera sp.]|nr:DUF4102 domain-containing protein [Acidisphaera sp.]
MSRRRLEIEQSARAERERIQALPPGRHGFGSNLWLDVRGRTRSWSFRFRLDGRDRQMGLGGWPDVPLDEAVARAQAHRRSVRAGTDPIEQRRAERK